MVNSNFRKLTDCSVSNVRENQFGDMNGDDKSHVPLCVNAKTSIYESLPCKYFPYRDIPPPLVSKQWLNSFYEESKTYSEDDGSDNDDAIPLADLKVTLSGIQSGDRGNATKPTQVIQRRRGRPRKQNDGIDETVANTFQESGNVTPDDNDWWSKTNDNDQESDMKSVNENDDDDDDDDTLELMNCELNDFIELDESTKTKTVKKINKKEKSRENLGVKLENSKTVFPCVECGKTFSAASTLKYHLRIHNGTLIKCTECDRGFTTNYLLKCHMRIHNGDLFMCHKCGRGFTTAELLKVHTRSHTGVRPYSCDTCGKSFPSTSNLTQHKETHEPEKKYLCFQCGSSFSQKRCLDGHMLSHGEKNHICTVCGKLWARKSDLSEHMRVHTGYKPYSCSHCPQKFTQASSLRRHQIVHMESNPIQCLTCGKMLKCDEYYKRHIKKHVKDKEMQNVDADKKSF